MSETFTNIEIKVKGYLKTALSAEAATTTIDVDFVDEDDPSTAITLQSDTLMFEIDPLNKTGKGSELVLATSNASDTPVTNRTRFSTCTRGLSKEGHEQTGSATRAKSWDVGTEVAIATGSMAKMLNLMIKEHKLIYPSNGASIQAPVYADSTARDAAITSPSNGMYVYNTDTGTIQQYISGAWANQATGAVVNASTTVAGKVELATQAELDAGTGSGGSGANLVPTPDLTGMKEIKYLDGLAQLVTSLIPVGIIMPYMAAVAPSGWLLCDGSEVSRTTYSGLFAVISDTFGGGNGSTTFNVPNLKNRTPMGVDTTAKTVIDSCETNWTAGANVVSATDAVNYKTGSKSIKLTVAAAAGAAQILGYYTVSVANLYGQTTIGLWLKSSIALSAGDLQYMIDDTAAIASPLETIDIPALQAGVWTKVYLTLANPQDDLNLISHGIYQVNDVGAFTLNIDDVAYGENYELGATGGAKTHTLAHEQSGIPAHTHKLQDYSGATATYTNFSATVGNVSEGTFEQVNANTPADAAQAHSLLQPYMGVNYIIKT